VLARRPARSGKMAALDTNRLDAIQAHQEFITLVRLLATLEPPQSELWLDALAIGTGELQQNYFEAWRK